jgi:hypothetical protein
VVESNCVVEEREEVRETYRKRLEKNREKRGV